MAASNKFRVKNRALPHTPHEDSHAILARGITSGLRTVLLRHVNHWARRSAWKAPLLRDSAKMLERVLDILYGYLGREFDRSRNRVPICNGNAVTLCADTRVVRYGFTF
jgi:hypothetical protein